LAGLVAALDVQVELGSLGRIVDTGLLGLGGLLGLVSLRALIEASPGGLAGFEGLGQGDLLLAVSRRARLISRR